MFIDRSEASDIELNYFLESNHKNIWVDSIFQVCCQKPLLQILTIVSLNTGKVPSCYGYIDRLKFRLQLSHEVQLTIDISCQLFGVTSVRKFT